MNLEMSVSSHEDMNDAVSGSGKSGSKKEESDDNYMELYVEKELKDRCDPLQE